jgi:hypothetical protein
MRDLCATWREERRGDEPIGFYGDLKHGIFFYTENRIDRLDTVPEVVEFLSPERRAFVIVERSKRSRIERDFHRAYERMHLLVADDSHSDYVLFVNRPRERRVPRRAPRTGGRTAA